MRITTKTEISAYPLLSRGKVRDIYDIDDKTLLIVTTDRMSAFDVIMDKPIPYKGVILNQITLFWMDKFKDIIPNHLVESDVDRFPAALAPWKDELEGVPYWSARQSPCLWKYRTRLHLRLGLERLSEDRTLCGYQLPAGMRESDKLETALFTPSTKAELGQHDQNISPEEASRLLGEDVARKVRETTLAIYEAGRAYAASRGIIVADTKFEFGFVDGELRLIDEVLTPDSSRFWPADQYEPGRSQPSFDKQYLRDWLTSQPWDMQPPAPALPAEIVDATARRYREAYHILTGKEFTI